MIRKINHRTKYVKIFVIKFDANYYHYVNDMKS